MEVVRGSHFDALTIFLNRWRYHSKPRLSDKTTNIQVAKTGDGLKLTVAAIVP